MHALRGPLARCLVRGDVARPAQRLRWWPDTPRRQRRRRLRLARGSPSGSLAPLSRQCPAELPRMRMFQPLSFAIGLRYLRAKRRNGFISFISMASILGILIGVMALITTISVMNGFQEELRERILGMVSHATIDGLDGPLQDWPHAVALSQKDARVLGAAPYVQTEALLQGARRQGALIRGVLPAQRADGLRPRHAR